MKLQSLFVNLGPRWWSGESRSLGLPQCPARGVDVCWAGSRPSDSESDPVGNDIDLPEDDDREDDADGVAVGTVVRVWGRGDRPEDEDLREGPPLRPEDEPEDEADGVDVADGEDHPEDEDRGDG